LFASGIVLSGAPEYRYARFVRGFVVGGRTRADEHVSIWSAIGGEVSNDHHPVYDLQFSDGGVLTRSHLDSSVKKKAAPSKTFSSVPPTDATSDEGVPSWHSCTEATA